MNDRNAPPETGLCLSPSVYHRRVLRQITPRLAYDGGDVKAWQQRLRRKLRELMGYGGEDRLPLKPRTLWRQDHELGTIEKLAFTAEPGADVLAYWCVPHRPRCSAPPYDAMICLQGHSTGMHVSIGREREDETRPRETQGDRDFAIGCMRRGLAALCIEQRSFGLRREQVQAKVSEHGCHDAVMHALMLGKTLAGERVYDVDRGIDYLAGRGDVNMATLGVMGNSGGGTISVYAAALLPRIRMSMPSCAFCTYASSLMSIYHCGDNYIPGILQWAEMADVLGLAAPRPVVVVAGRDDPIFPVSGVRAAFRRLKSIYAAAGAADRCHLVVGPEGHRFYADLAWKPGLREIARLG